MKRIIILTLLMISLISVVFCRPDYKEDVEFIVGKMTLDQKIGQLLMFGLPGSSMNSMSEKLITKFKPGGVIFFGFNIKSTPELKRYIEDLQKLNSEKNLLPLLVSIDQEGGRVRRITDGVTQFPGAMASGICNDKELQYISAKTIAVQLRYLGINMNLAPDIDINSNPDNPVINTRAFGSDLETVKNMGTAYIKGLQSGGVMAVAKHFPGHGDTAKDSHKTLPVITHDIEYLLKNDLVPFKSAIDSNTAGIMTAHISYPSILKDDRPATLSKYFLTDILRNKMKYKGVIMTDDLEMGAVAQNIDIGEAAVQAIESGADIILITTFKKSPGKITSAIKKAYNEGRITEQMLNDSVKRIVSLRFYYNMISLDEEKNIKVHKYFVSDKDKELLRNAENINYQISSKGLLYYNPQKIKLAKNDNETSVIINAAFLKKHLSEENYIFADKNNFNKYILNDKNKYHIYYKAKYSRDYFLNILEKLNKKENITVTLLNINNPYDLTKRKNLLPTLFSFSDTDMSIKAMAHAIDGKIVPKEAAPLNLGVGR